MKRILAIIILLTTVFLLWTFTKILPDCYLNAGKNDYKQNNYTSAFKNLKLAVMLNPKDKDARYYYAQTLINLKPTLEVQKELFNLTKENLPDSADLIADRQLSKWKRQIMVNFGNNYIEQAPFNNQILRWDIDKFPLKVYIQKNSAAAPQYFVTAIRSAFLQWQKATNNFINFNFVNSEKDANIKVSINTSAEMKKCTEEGCKYTVGYTTPVINGELLKRMDILFYDSNNLGIPFKKEEIYNTALHEIGHSLGIMGHSYNKDDLMYMEANSNSSAFFKSSGEDYKYISSADLNTLNLLYKLTPDITNTALSAFDTKQQFYAPIVTGNQETVNSRKVQEAKNYIKSAPDLPNGYIDLALAYSEQKQYSDATDALNKALSLCSNDNEKFIIYYNFAVIHMEIKNWDDALKYADLAKQANPATNIDGLIAMINYRLGNKELAKKSYEEAIAKSPENIIDSYNLAVIYIREFNFAQAGKTINKLITSNPEAKRDSRVKSLIWLTFIFK